MKQLNIAKGVRQFYVYNEAPIIVYSNIVNYWCPLKLKRHDKTLRNASKHGVADSFFKTKPPLIK